ncbi:hypothetical protein LR48_Vigan10g203500 [Vigna angularis]|uniref:Uncharacterized protein n=1 Tax=Phaseolus angularis TaxID=3914 RepID=A0A0L9VME5_PHAAN|nr:hypothetical protein LR48_Vigan10g203500 [Vigna angularis]
MTPVTFPYRPRFYNRGPSSAVLSRPVIWGFTAKTTTYQKCTTQKLHSTIYNINKRHHQQIRSFAVAVGTEDRVPQIVTVPEAEATQSPLREKRAMVPGRRRPTRRWGRNVDGGRGGGDELAREAEAAVTVARWRNPISGRGRGRGRDLEEPATQRSRSGALSEADAVVTVTRWRNPISGRGRGIGRDLEEPVTPRSRSGGTRDSEVAIWSRDAEAAVEEVVEPAMQRKNGEQEEGEVEEREAVEVLI